MVGWDGGLLEGSGVGLGLGCLHMVAGQRGMVLTPPGQCFLLLFGQETQSLLN